MTAATMHSALYTGVVTHTRLLPRRHHFSYHVSMVYLDLSELEQVFSQSSLWSLERFNLATFRRTDYYGDKSESLEESIRSLVEEETGVRPEGRICLLTNLRYFGYIINPISCYYCFDANDQLSHVVAEVTNTPWRQRHAYVLPWSEAGKGNGGQHDFDKRMHVSPFMPLEMSYRWRNSVPGERLTIAMENLKNGERQFTASLNLQRTELGADSMRTVLIRYPLTTVKVGLGIYWQALKLWWKGIPFFPNLQKRAGQRPAQDSAKEKSIENHLS